MLKSLILIFSLSIGYSAFAQSSYETCVKSLKYYYLASQAEADVVCRQDSSESFLKCMVREGINTNHHVLSVAPFCTQKRMNLPLDSSDPTYNNFYSCSGNLQSHAYMESSRARQICQWDSSPTMQFCLVSLVGQAGFHPEHAIQYCSFANTEYRNKIPEFVSCAIRNAQQGLDVYSNVVSCDQQITHPTPPTSVEPTQTTQQPQQYTPPTVHPTQKPEVKDQTPVDQKTKSNNSTEKTAEKPSGRKVPTPVEIKIEKSSKPNVKDQPLNTGSTSNSESLPL